MKLSPKEGTNFITDKLDQNKLRSDLENVVDFYHEHSYFEAGTEDVKFVDINMQQSNKNPMQDIVIYLKEGKPYHSSVNAACSGATVLAFSAIS